MSIKAVFLAPILGGALLLSTGLTQAALSTDIQAILAQSGQPAQVGVLIQNPNTQKILYSQSSQYLFTPASVQKLLTAVAALAYLGPDFTYKTILLANGFLDAQHVWNGDITIKFSGDPEFTTQDLKQLLAILKTKGITRIQGKIKLDVSTYDQVPYPPGWLWEDLSYYYAAPLIAATIDKNKFVLTLTPVKNNTHPNLHTVSLSTNLPDSVIHLINQTRMRTPSEKSCPLTIYSDEDNRFILRGCVNPCSKPQYRSLALRNPLPYIKYVITHALHDIGISYSSIETVAFPTPPSPVIQYDTFALHVSPPLSVVVKHMLKKSDNLIADSLLKQLGYQYYHQPGSWVNGVAALKAVLSKPTGIDFSKGLMNDGAGLSRYNLISPAALVLLLNYVYSQDLLRNVLMDALPIGGVDGTLAERLQRSAPDKRVHAKTGSMTGVSALAGYVYTQHLGPLVFAIVVNGFVGKPRHFSHVEDKICEYLIKYGGK